MDRKGFGRKGFRPNRGAIPGRIEENLRQDAWCQTEIRIVNLPNTTLKRHH
jgi:hypothetical protein